jgi:hypothetical protein
MGLCGNHNSKIAAKGSAAWKANLVTGRLRSTLRECPR